MSKYSEQIIKIWSYNQVPEPLKQLSDGRAEWVVLIPAGFALPEIEAMFLQCYAGNYSLVRRTLIGESVLFLGGDRKSGIADS